MISDKFKVGVNIQQKFCKLKKKVVFVGNDYLVCESLGQPALLLEENYDLWEVVNDEFDGINEYVLARAYNTNILDGGDFTDFLRKLKQYRQDFIESATP